MWGRQPPGPAHLHASHPARLRAHPGAGHLSGGRSPWRGMEDAPAGRRAGSPQPAVSRPFLACVTPSVLPSQKSGQHVPGRRPRETGLPAASPTTGTGTCTYARQARPSEQKWRCRDESGLLGALSVMNGLLTRRTPRLSVGVPVHVDPWLSSSKSAVPVPFPAQHPPPTDGESSTRRACVKAGAQVWGKDAPSVSCNKTGTETGCSWQNPLVSPPLKAARESRLLPLQGGLTGWFLRQRGETWRGGAGPDSQKQCWWVLPLLPPRHRLRWDGDHSWASPKRGTLATGCHPGRLRCDHF